MIGLYLATVIDLHQYVLEYFAYSLIKSYAWVENKK